MVCLFRAKRNPRHPRRRLSAVSSHQSNLPCSTLGFSAQDHAPGWWPLLCHLLPLSPRVPCGGCGLHRGSACTRVHVDSQAYPRSILQTQEKTFLVPFLASARHRFPSMVASVQIGTLLSLCGPFCWSPRTIFGLLLAFSGCSHSEPGSAALLPRVQMLLLPALQRTEAPSLLSQLTFLNTGLLSKPESLGESAVCHSSLTDWW